jgi:endoglucanase
MKLRLTVLSCLAAASALAAGERGEILFKTDFESDEPLRAWRAEGNPNVRIVPGFQSAQGLQVATSVGLSNVSVRLQLPVEALRGARLQCDAVVRASEVSPPPQPWNGVKFMLVLAGPEPTIYAQQDNVAGTFDWRRISFTTRVPASATNATLVLGLEQVSGLAAFDDVRIRILTPARARPAVAPTGPVFKGHSLPRLRGAMIGPQFGTNDLRVLAGEWGANHIRWQLIWGGFPASPADTADLPAYDQWLEGELCRLDALLPELDRAGVKLVLDLHTPPGGRLKADSVCRIFQERKFQDHFVAVWERLARRYRTADCIWAYDLVNEPCEGSVPDDLLDWQGLALRTARAIRAIDPERALIIEPAPWGGPAALENLAPLSVPGIVYSVHMYEPHAFTHQGVYDKRTGLTYPGAIEGRQWDQAALRRVLQPVVDFQRDYGVHIYLGEFSAIRWAPGSSAHDYLRDCITIFEEQGWDWAYHAFREWDGWSVEHGPEQANRARVAPPTDREQLLRAWFAKNARPGSAEAKR